MSVRIKVALNRPVDRLFTYTVPKELSTEDLAGRRVVVSFGHKKQIGVVFGEDCTQTDIQLKNVEEILDPFPLINSDMIKLAEAVSNYYLCPLGQVVSALLPPIGRRLSLDDVAGVKNAGNNYERKEPAVSLTDKQKEALDEILKLCAGGGSDVLLLHGVTASGKTEVYMRAIADVLRAGKGAIVLVPEISLTPQTLNRFRDRFGAQIALLHSAMTGKERLKEWFRLKTGQAKIAIGARSCVFAPIESLGIIIIDEEHETTYKQEDQPRYHAREVAIMRSKIQHCPVILGSATPSLESFEKAQNNIYRYARLPDRIDGKILPDVQIVDMKRDAESRKKHSLFSRPLESAISTHLANNNQIIIFINRRGFATFLSCLECGYVFKCRNCDIAYVYHSKDRLLRCHYCAHKLSVPEKCLQCQSRMISYHGFGSEKIESEIHRTFPGSRIARMDSDTTKKRGAHERILEDFKSGRIDILIGTQMIAKGLDYPRVTLVGVILADITLNIPDFRSSERTFNLLTQVAGRAGRGQRKGQVLIQTYTPANYVFEYARTHDYLSFFEKEIRIRRELHYPPCAHLIAIFARSRFEGRLQKCLLDVKYTISKSLPEGCDITVDGPGPRVISKISGSYRWQLLLWGGDLPALRGLVEDAVQKTKRPHAVYIGIDVDPLHL